MFFTHLLCKPHVGYRNHYSGGPPEDLCDCLCLDYGDSIRTHDIRTFTEEIYGEPDGNEAIDIDDAVFLVNHIFSGGPPPNPEDRGDADCSGSIDKDDVAHAIVYIFAGVPRHVKDVRRSDTEKEY